LAGQLADNPLLLSIWVRVFVNLFSGLDLTLLSPV
jgi:hypothetical protein